MNGGNIVASKPEVLPTVASLETLSPFSLDEAASDPPTPMPSVFRLQWLQLQLHHLGALSAPGIGESMMDAEVLPEAGQAGPTTMKP